MLGRGGLPTLGKWGRIVNANDTVAALTVNQRSTGDILDIQDGGVSVFKVADGGTITVGGAIAVADDILFKIGTDGDQAFLNRSTVLNADTVLASVLVGTVESQALAANSLMIANATSNGDIALYINKGGNSQMGFWIDGSAGDTALLAASGASIDHYIAGIKELDHASGAFAFQVSTALTGVSSFIGVAAATSLTIAGHVTGGAAAQRDIVIQTGNAANPQILATRLTIGSNAATAVATWANITHSGIVITSGDGIKSAASDTATLLLVAVNTALTETTVAQITSHATTPTFDIAKGKLTGSLNANSQTIGVIASVQLGAWYHQDTNYDAIQMNMSSGIEIRTRNVDNTASVSRLIIGISAATAVATWANITHTGLVLSASEKLKPISGVAGFAVVSTAFTLGSLGSVIIPQSAANATDVLAGNIAGAISLDLTGAAERLYFRGASSWFYIAKTGGLSMTKEELIDPNGHEFQIGDKVELVVDKINKDGSFHALPYRRIE